MGEAEIPGLTDNTIPRRLGPKRASKIRKLFNLTKEDDVCQYVIKRPLPLKDGKKQKFAAPKVQRLVTPVMLQRKRHRLALKRRSGEKPGKKKGDPETPEGGDEEEAAAAEEEYDEEEEEEEEYDEEEEEEEEYDE